MSFLPPNQQRQSTEGIHNTNTKKINILKKVFLTLMVYSQEESCVESSWSDCGINIFFGSIGFLCFAAAAFATQHFIGLHNGGLCAINKVSSKNI